MNRSKIIGIRLLAGIFVVIPLLLTCERFDPKGELYFYADSVSAGKIPGSYLLTGAVLNVGDKSISDHGFCWADHPDPAVGEDSSVHLGSLSGPKEFSATLNGLSANTRYYARVFVTSGSETLYSREGLDFTTEGALIPEVRTERVTNITQDSATTGGTIVNDGGAEISAFGVCWSTTGLPTLDDRHTIDTLVTEDSFVSILAGLNCATRYVVRAYATNEAGTAYGDTIHFVTSECTAGIPQITTLAATSIGETTAILNAIVSDDGGNFVSERGFYYGTSEDPVSGGTRVTVGNGTGSYSSSVSGLSPGTTYYFAAFATNSGGTTTGSVESFKTLPSASTPVVSTLAATSVRDKSARLNGNVMDDGGAAVSERGFYYGTTSDPANEGIRIKAGTGLGTYDTIVTGLITGTTYYFTAYATNSAGTSTGSVENFTPTSEVTLPTVTTEEATSLRDTSAVLNGVVDDDGGAEVTERGFYYGTASNPYPSGTKVTEGNGTGSFSTGVSGLTAGVTYYFTAYAVNSAGTATGDTRSFTPTANVVAPSVTTLAASNVGETAATINGYVTDDGGALVTERGFYYGTSSDPANGGTKITEGGGTGSFSSTLNALDPGTTYYFVSFATNSEGTSYGEVNNFTTSPEVNPPDVTTYAASSVEATAAILNGIVTTNGGATVTERGFYYGTSSDPASSGTKVTVGSGTGSFSTPITGLSQGTTYFFTAFATNSEGTSYGAVQSFNTLTEIVPPTVETFDASSVGETSATLNGNLKNNGGDGGVERGFYYGTSSDPASSGTKIMEGTGHGTFSYTLSTLSPGTTYYFVAYGTNSAGTALGDVRNFTTSANIVQATVETFEASSVGETSATLNGNLKNDGGDTGVERGFYYGTSSNPVSSGTKLVEGNGPGTYSYVLSGLSPSTTYYYVAYGTNSAGTSYGEERNFTTDASSGTTVTDYDGNVYPTVQIGTQLWMAENLKVTHYADGTPIPNVTGNSEWGALGSSGKAYAWFDNSNTKKDLWGGLYTWAGATNGASGSGNPSGVQGACPNGWHLPSDAEWKVLDQYLGMSASEADQLNVWRGTDQGDQMKTSGTTYWDSPNTGTNSSGFSARGSGIRHNTNGLFQQERRSGIFWTATQTSTDDAYNRYLDLDHSESGRGSLSKKYGFAVRCVKD